MKSTKARLLLPLLLALLLLSACSAPQAAPAVPDIGDDVQINNGIMVLTKEQALEDYDYIWAGVEANFPYLDEIDDALDIDWRGVKTQYRDKLEGACSTRGITQTNYMHIIKECFGNFRSLGHLYVIESDMYYSMISAFENIAQDEGGKFFAKYLDVIKSPLIERFYALRGRGAAQQGGGSAELTLEQIRGEVDKTVQTGERDGVPYAKISAFMWTDSRGMDMAIERLKTFCADNISASDIIIDVRSNGGGSDVVWMSGLVEPLISQKTAHRKLMGYKSGGINEFFIGDDGFSDDSYITLESGAWKEYFPHVSREALEPFDKFVIATTELKPIGAGFGGRIWVLTDSGCFSSTDAFAGFCKQTGFATLVGETTGGNGLGSQPFVITAPNSGMLVYYEAFFAFNEDGSCNGITGTKPDIAVGKGEDALEACLAAIRGQA